MRGNQPQHAPRAIQNFADGGIVGGIKSALGFKPKDPDRERRIAEYRADKQREKDAAEARANKPSPERAITQCAGGRAL